MKGINTEHCIVPIGEFKTKASRLLRELKDESSPLVVTQNGRAAAVILSPKAFDELREHNQYLEAVVEGITEANAGETIEHKDVKNWLQSWGGTNESDVPK